MKALKILNDYKKFDGFIRDAVSDIFLNEAIAELEALENRSCENCVYYLSDNGNYPLEPCGECNRWYSDSWESK